MVRWRLEEWVFEELMEYAGFTIGDDEETDLRFHVGVFAESGFHFLASSDCLIGRKA